MAVKIQHYIIYQGIKSLLIEIDITYNSIEFHKELSLIFSYKQV